MAYSMSDIYNFQNIVWGYYLDHKRDLPWRQPESDGSFDAYKILISEIMLQQTQVNRVIPKFESFIRLFPTSESLAKARLGDVLRAWDGLGYNRRAKYLHNSVKVLISGVRPWKYEDLVACPGIGSNTAGAILVYAYNQPAMFIETNIRTVYIHHFFKDQTAVSDKAILQILVQTLSYLAQRKIDNLPNYREFYWALMDYGAHLKTTIGNAARASKLYARQSVFEGSRRQIRGQILRLLGGKSYSRQAFSVLISDERLETVLDDLLKEGLIVCIRSSYRLA